MIDLENHRGIVKEAVIAGLVGAAGKMIAKHPMKAAMGTLAAADTAATTKGAFQSMRAAGQAGRQAARAANPASIRTF